MKEWPVLEREPVELPVLTGHKHTLWHALVETVDQRPRAWTLMGGQIVFLHATEHRVIPPRVSARSGRRSARFLSPTQIPIHE